MFNYKRRKQELKKLEELKMKVKELEELKSEGLEELVSEINRLNDHNEELEYKNENLTRWCSEIEAFNNSLKKNFLSVIPSDADYEAIYKSLADVFDSGGYCLHDMAQKMTHIDVCSAFPTEDNMGYFEEADGYALLSWIVKAKFGEIEWEQLNPPYEKAGNVSFEGQEENISEFYKELYKATVLKLLS